MLSSHDETSDSCYDSASKGWKIAPLGHSSDPPQGDVQLANLVKKKAQAKCESSASLSDYISSLEDESLYIHILYYIQKKQSLQKK